MADSVERALAVVISLADLLIIGLGVMLLLDRNSFKSLPLLILSFLYYSLAQYGFQGTPHQNGLAHG